MSIAGWSAREVEREEVVPLGLDLGAGGDREAQLTEEADDLVHDPRHRMLRTDPAPAAGHGEVHARGLPPAPLGAEHLGPRGEGRLELRLELVHRGPVAFPFLDPERRQRLERAGEHAALPAEHGGALGLERVGAQRRDGVESWEQGVEIGVACRVAHQ